MMSFHLVFDVLIPQILKVILIGIIGTDKSWHNVGKLKIKLLLVQKFIDKMKNPFNRMFLRKFVDAEEESFVEMVKNGLVFP